MVMPVYQRCPKCGMPFLGSDCIVDPCPSCRDIRREVITRLAKSVEVSLKLHEKSNKEIADLLMEHVWANMDCTSPQSDLVAEAIERLKAFPS